jgi:hydrogenase expression/formation protein HypE
VYTNGACVGDQVLITKGVAMEGTAILAQDFEDVATELGMNKQDLEEARSLINEISVVKEALVLAKIGTSAMHDVTRGGLLETLLEIAHLSGVGIEVDTSRMLIRPIVTSFAQAFKFDPLKMISSGSLVATVHPKRMTEISRTLTKMGIPFANIGRVKKGKDVSLLLGDKVIRYHKIRCEEDELARMWTLYPRDK